MSRSSNWIRVSRSHPCPICGKGDWCTFHTSGRWACCARVESDHRLGEAGWRHPVGSACAPAALPPASDARKLTTSELEELQRTFLSDAAGRLDTLASGLGVFIRSLERLAVGWSSRHRAWTFPMTDHLGLLRGFRLRLHDGRKISVKGGHEGLFLPAGVSRQVGRLVVVEGPSDCAAGLDLGLPVVGRPSCTGGSTLLVALVRSCRPGQLVICADADVPGRRGADALAAVLAVFAPDVRVVEPLAQHKDLRGWLQAGATHEDFEALVAAAPRWRLKVRNT